MQIRRASFPTNSSQPPCPFEHEDLPCLHQHGHYTRFSQPEGSGESRIPRFLCKFTGKTVSILPDQFLPYRPINLPVVQAHFDQLADATQDPDPEPCRVKRGCLIRAWKRFTSTERKLSLIDFFGQRLPRTNSPQDLWNAMRHAAGHLSQILLELAVHGKSLLGDYQCLKPY